MKKKFLFFLSKIFIVFLISSSTFANIIDPQNFIQEIVDDTKKILVATNTNDYKAKELTEIAKAKVDINGIGLYTLGSYRKQLNDDQKKEYVILFEKYFLTLFKDDEYA